MTWRRPSASTRIATMRLGWLPASPTTEVHARPAARASAVPPFRISSTPPATTASGSPIAPAASAAGNTGLAFKLGQPYRRLRRSHSRAADCLWATLARRAPHSRATRTGLQVEPRRRAAWTSLRRRRRACAWISSSGSDSRSRASRAWGAAWPRCPVRRARFPVTRNSEGLCGTRMARSRRQPAMGAAGRGGGGPGGVFRRKRRSGTHAQGRDSDGSSASQPDLCGVLCTRCGNPKP